MQIQATKTAEYKILGVKKENWNVSVDGVVLKDYLDRNRVFHSEKAAMKFAENYVSTLVANKGA